ncbi:hypothetical protein [Pontibacter anaerobius]|uniref:Uncharacterized protein n=1 Tax=Pontibacter anaerobius TaxID=2993940 RepID=A0ABT3RCU0_9BACT|nr:hypothetical protein [Pontibacter anaerobius]MCX2739649.1 hypothetical protein [Pontibacter anaerobius]
MKTTLNTCLIAVLILFSVHQSHAQKSSKLKLGRVSDVEAIFKAKAKDVYSEKTKRQLLIHLLVALP